MGFTRHEKNIIQKKTLLTQNEYNQQYWETIKKKKKNAEQALNKGNSSYKVMVPVVSITTQNKQN